MKRILGFCIIRSPSKTTAGLQWSNKGDCRAKHSIRWFSMRSVFNIMFLCWNLTTWFRLRANCALPVEFVFFWRVASGEGKRGTPRRLEDPQRWAFLDVLDATLVLRCKVIIYTCTNPCLYSHIYIYVYFLYMQQYSHTLYTVYMCAVWLVMPVSLLLCCSHLFHAGQSPA